MDWQIKLGRSIGRRAKEGKRLGENIWPEGMPHDGNKDANGGPLCNLLIGKFEEIDNAEVTPANPPRIAIINAGKQFETDS